MGAYARASVEWEKTATSAERAAAEIEDKRLQREANVEEWSSEP
jgi:hypothetical protein